MIKHHIIMGSAYSIGKRIALDFCSSEDYPILFFQKSIADIKKACGDDIAISTHMVQTDSEEWKSVCKLDKFFEGVELLYDIEQFISLILEDRELSGLDVAKYILSIIPCTHLKLEKLTYLCYADYICKYDQKLFNDKIYAYRLGPVIASVYDHYRKSGKGNLLEEDDRKNYDEGDKKMSNRSRIVASKDGLQKLLSIEQTLERYKNYEASELVNITHRMFSPWYQAGAGEEVSKEITDELVKKYHINECI